MRKKIAFALGVCLLSYRLYAQSPGVIGVLQQVEQNNKELKALASLVEGKQLGLQSGNNLPDPQLIAFYLPFGEHTTGDYTEFQVSQSFEFPTVYGARNGLIEKQKVQLELEYAARRQEILLAAQKYCRELTYLDKRMTSEQKRVEQAKTVYEQVQELYKKEQVSILELDKAKVAWMQEQFKVQQIESDQRNLLLLLENLNGGRAVTFLLREYTTSLELGSKDSLWQDKLDRDPVLKQFRQQETIAQQQLKLAKNKALPGWTAGYNTQGVAGERFSGVYGGISIPLWSNRNKVKAAQSHLEFRETSAASGIMKAHASFEKQYNEHQVMLARFQEYQSTLSGLNSDELLLRAYQLGEISFLEYYMELQFYRQAYDAMLEIQHRLYQSQAELLKHQL